jgi:PhnB protein
MKAKQPVPAGFHTLTPHLTVKGAKDAIDFYGKAFGAKEIRRHAMGDTIAHAQLQIGSSMLMLMDEFPEHGPFGPEGETGTVLHLYVPDVDASFKRAVEAGARVVMPVEDMFWGDRYGIVQDPFGHRWSIASNREELTPEEVMERAAKAFSGGDCG